MRQVQVDLSFLRASINFESTELLDLLSQASEHLLIVHINLLLLSRYVKQILAPAMAQESALRAEMDTRLLEQRSISYVEVVSCDT